jgi:putative ABC transport system ATP-binding protein
VPISIRQLKKSYAAPDGSRLDVLDVPDLTVADGEQIALLGGSGGGKTTLLHCIAGIVRADAGAVVFDLPGLGAIDLCRLDESTRDRFRGRHVGYIFQSHHLLPGLTALENVLCGMSFTGRRVDHDYARNLLNTVGLGDRLDYKPAKLSVGQQQRVAVARALANRPALVLADEPTGALDAGNARIVIDLIRNLCREAGSSLLIVTHDRDIAAGFQRQLQLSQINHAGPRGAA